LLKFELSILLYNALRGVVGRSLTVSESLVETGRR